MLLLFPEIQTPEKFVDEWLVNLSSGHTRRYTASSWVQNCVASDRVSAIAASDRALPCHSSVAVIPS